MTRRGGVIPGRGGHGGRGGRGFTVVELMVVMAVIAVVAVVVYPTLTSDDRLRVMAASAVMSSDLEFAQVLSISEPDDPIVFRFDPPNDTYWIARASAPDTPIMREDQNAAYLVELGRGRARSANGVTFELVNVTNNTIAWDPQGGLSSFGDDAMIVLRRGDEAITLTIASITGTLTETDGDLSAP